MINNSSLAFLAGTSAAEKKAFDIRILNVSHITTIADYFVVCSGNSTTQIKAIADEIEDKMQEKGILVNHKEGYQTARWVLLDYGNIIVHVFHKEDREFYNIERFWSDADAVSI